MKRANSRIFLQDFEEDSIVFLRAQGFRVKPIPPSRVSGVKTPDLLIDSQKWEMKSPLKAARGTIEHAFAAARKQADNLIFDLRRIHGNNVDAQVIPRLSRLFRESRGARRMMIITKSGELKHFEK